MNGPASAGAGLQAIQVRPGHPDFLDLPWHLPVSRWREATDRLVEVEIGLCRHEVVFASYGGVIYALKELPTHLGHREYELLQWLEDRELPAVMPAGHARARSGAGEEHETSLLITRFLEGSVPYRTLFMSPGMTRYRERLMDAMAGLLVRLHLAGFYWGDFSLSNTLFRRDAGELHAVLVDAETSEFHEQLSPGMRRQDLFIMEENVAGELADLRALAELTPPAGADRTGPGIRERYEHLWDEITREEIIAPHENYRIHERARALNELGFSVREIELIPSGDGRQLRVRTMVTDRMYHHHLLHSLTGVVARDRQAALMLNEIREMRALLGRERNRSVPMSEAAFQWRHGRYDPTVRRLRPLETEVADPPELYCQVLEHKWFLSEKARQDVGLERALEDYLQRFQKK